MEQAAYKKALQYIEQGNYTLAIKEFDKSLEASPHHFEAYYNRSAAKYKVQDLAGALQDIDKALELVPDNADAWSHRGIVQHMSGNSQAAIKDFDKAQQLEPENAYRYSSRAFIKAAMKDVKGAVADYEQALKLDPEDAIAHNNLGLLEEQAGKIEAAKKRFQKADDLAGIQHKDQEFERPDMDELIKEWKKEQAEAEAASTPAADQTVAHTIKTEAVAIRPKHYWQIIKGVFSQKELWSEFVGFVKNGFQLKEEDKIEK
ncbi:tetratricopeptide repeat protein [Algivirga pacifica]|uniref:Tetratricopeptide repeat-containing protein n=1 Tax=Algivirga pacifica TaxID=1162670 RepID=A0ABP9CWA6_9BACT